MFGAYVNVRCLGLLLGVEQAVMPLFDLSALALSMLVFSGRRDLRAYVVSSIPNHFGR